MKDQSFTLTTLARKITREDVFKDNSLFIDSIRKSHIQQAFDITERLFNPPLNIDTIKLGNKAGYKLKNLSDKLVLRRSLENLKTSIQISMKHRNTIGHEIISYLKEGTKYRVYKLDISSFFESIDINALNESFMQIAGLSIQTKHILNSFFESFKNQYGFVGIPRGIEISSFASELIMQNFDLNVKDHNEVFYYSRFVDDILIITSSNEEQKPFFSWLKTILPKGLKFNHNKQNVFSVGNRSQQTPPPHGGKIDAEFNYLGYKFSVIDPLVKPKEGLYRNIKVNLSCPKIKKIKTRISRSIYSYQKTNDFTLLYDRLFFLTSNRNLLNKKSSKIVPTGIYYNYPLLSYDSDSLEDLDSFLATSITSNHGRLGRKVLGKLSKHQCKTLLKLSFKQGFKKRVFKTFSPQRLKEISTIW